MLYLRDVRPTARGGHRVIFEALELEELVPAGLPKSYDDLRVKRNTVEYPDVYIEEVDLASIHRCIEIGDQLLAMARSVSS